MAAVALIVPLSAWVAPLAIVVAVAVGAWVAWSRPAVLVAVAVNGFFLYLAVLAASGRIPHTRTTAPYYAVLGLLLLGVAVRRRRHVLATLRERAVGSRVWVVSAFLLGVWFLANGALLRAGGSEAKHLVGQFVLVTAPAALAVLAFERAEVEQLWRALIALGLVFVAIELGVFAAGSQLVAERFTPLHGLDPISAATIPAVAAAAVYGWRTRSARHHRVKLALLALFFAATLAEGSRGPAVALFLTVAAVAALTLSRRAVLDAAATLVAGILIGLVAAQGVGTGNYLKQGFEDTAHLGRQSPQPTHAGGGTGTGTGTGKPHRDVPRAADLSTVRLRAEWLRLSFDRWTEKPIFGHGISALPNDTSGARLMGTYGTRIYPHNDFAEAIYSLGIVGFLLFVAFVCAAFVGSISLLRRRRGPLETLAFALLLLFFLESNFSGEIGADVGLWASSALVVALRAR